MEPNLSTIISKSCNPLHEPASSLWEVSASLPQRSSLKANLKCSISMKVMVINLLKRWIQITRTNKNVCQCRESAESLHAQGGIENSAVQSSNQKYKTTTAIWNDDKNCFHENSLPVILKDLRCFLRVFASITASTLFALKAIAEIMPKDDCQFSSVRFYTRRNKGKYEKHSKKYSNFKLFVYDAAKSFGKAYEIFIERVQKMDIGMVTAKPKLFTFQEFLVILLNVNESILTNMEELQLQLNKHMQYAQSAANNDCSRSGSINLMRYHTNIDSLIKFVRNAHHNENLDCEDLSFKTMQRSQLLAVSVPNIQEEHESDKTNLQSFYFQRRSGKLKLQTKIHRLLKILVFKVAEKRYEIERLNKKLKLIEKKMLRNSHRNRREEISKDLVDNPKHTQATNILYQCGVI